ncbi:MAG: NUDIX domain-containing protein [Anaerolineae bacterium]|nr:NUDIX hydrolase [Anaerolineae bacterium]MDW8067838.1 NUDIX domain-containing protein [Anaerolineae bacterium]
MVTDDHRPMVTVDVVMFTLREDDLQVLLVQRRHPPFAGMWAIPGGFVDMGESLEDAARRELEEETGVRSVPLEQLGAFGDPGRDPRGRVITVAYFALIPPDRVQPRAGDDAAEARWWSLRALPPLAFDHDRILHCARKRLRRELMSTPIASELLPETFSLDTLQRVYETLLGEKLDRREFRRRILAAGLLQEVRPSQRSESRSVRHYRFREDTIAEWRAQC